MMRIYDLRFTIYVLCAMASVRLNAGPALVVAPPNGHVTLKWQYDTNLLATNLTFCWYEATNITTPLSQYRPITNVVGTNLSVALDIAPGEHYFVGTASNFWGETSIASTIASTPPLAVPMTAVKIDKAP